MTETKEPQCTYYVIQQEADPLRIVDLTGAFYKAAKELNVTSTARRFATVESTFAINLPYMECLGESQDLRFERRDGNHQHVLVAEFDNQESASDFHLALSRRIGEAVRETAENRPNIDVRDIRAPLPCQIRVPKR